MIAALYVRVSTSDQDNSLQISELQAYCKARGWDFIVFEDKMSGARSDRPGLAAVMEAARKRMVDVVVVLRLDRFGRSVQDLTNNLAELESAGVRFLAVAQGIDTEKSNPVGRFLVTILAAVAQFERELICERVQAGVNKAKANGRQLGRPLKVFRRDEVAKLRARGWSIRRIADKLEISTMTVQRTLKASVTKSPDWAEVQKVERERLTGRLNGLT